MQNNPRPFISTFILKLVLIIRPVSYHITRKANISVDFALTNVTQIFVIRRKYDDFFQVSFQMFSMVLTLSVIVCAEQTCRISRKM